MVQVFFEKMEIDYRQKKRKRVSTHSGLSTVAVVQPGEGWESSVERIY